MKRKQKKSYNHILKYINIFFQIIDRFIQTMHVEQIIFICNTTCKQNKYSKNILKELYI